MATDHKTTTTTAPILGSGCFLIVYYSLKETVSPCQKFNLLKYLTHQNPRDIFAILDAYQHRQLDKLLKIRAGLSQLNMDVRKQTAI